MEKLRVDLMKMKKKSIIYHSTSIEIEKNDEGEYLYHEEYPDRIKKKALKYPKYRDVKLGTFYDKKKNGSLVFMGELYNLIGVDVDNKDDTIDKYEELCKTNKFNRNTFTIKTVNDGFHEYYRLTVEQKEKLKNFCASTGNLYGLNIDIKYTNQLLFGPSVFGDDNEFTYEIINDNDPLILPEFLFNEILKHVNFKKEKKDEATKIENNSDKKEPKKMDIKEKIQKKQFDEKKLNKINELVDMLSEQRADIRDPWYRLGCCLHNIDNSLLSVWIEFSKKCKHKFKEGECEKLWSEMTNEGLNMGSLHYWAENDNQKKYYEFKNKNLLKNIENSYSMTNDDLAKIFYKLKKNVLKCAQEEPKPIWYILDGGIWEKLEGTSKIRSMINKNLIPIYRKHLIYLSQKNLFEDITDKEKDEHDKNIIIINKLITKLKSFSFVSEVIKQSIQYFKEDKFVEKLDINPDILCFGKDLLDLKTCEWRETLPTDYCSLKCGVTKDEITDEHIDFLNNVLLDIFNTEEKKQYMLNQFSTFLNGRNLKQLFYIHLGSGGNGKTLIQEYLKGSFGEYFCDLPTSLITQKEGKANEANPELCRGRGKRIAFFAEPEEGSKANNSVLKKWSGGDRISCRPLYENSYQYPVLFKIIILCNTKFELQDIQDTSTTRRIIYTKFKSLFVYEPKVNFEKLRVDEYLSEEYVNKIKGSFMFMLIENYKKLKENNFKLIMPEDMIVDRNEFIDNNDEVKTFFKNECVKTNNEIDYMTLKDLFSNFLDYAKKNNIKTNVKEKNFKERLCKELPYKERFQPRINGKQYHLRSVFTNTKMNNDEEDINDLDN